MDDALNIAICLLIITSSVFGHELGHALIFWFYKVKVWGIIIGTKIPYLSTSFRLPPNRFLETFHISPLCMDGFTCPKNADLHKLSKYKQITALFGGIIINYIIITILLIILGEKPYEAITKPFVLMFQIPLYFGKYYTEIFFPEIRHHIPDILPSGHWALRFAMIVNLIQLWGIIPFPNSDGSRIFKILFSKSQKQNPVSK